MFYSLFLGKKLSQAVMRRYGDLDENGQPHNHTQDQSVYFLIDINDRRI